MAQRGKRYKLPGVFFSKTFPLRRGKGRIGIKTYINIE
jgi:hypothetical protein